MRYFLIQTGDVVMTDTQARVLFFGALLLTAGCRGESAPASKTSTAVRVRAVERSSATSATRFSATINPASRVDLAFKVGGYVHRVASVRGAVGHSHLLQEGDRVSVGQELA